MKIFNPIMAAALGAALMLAACAETGAPAPAPGPTGQSQQQGPRTAQIDPAQARRLQGIMAPLIQKMNNPIPAGQVRLTVWDDSHINAANGGGGNFYVTTGLLAKASDARLRAILAHEVAHADLGHVAKAERLNTGLSIGIALLDQILPGSSALTPVAGTLIANAYGRGEETAADAHGVQILNRAGYPGKAALADALTWIGQVEGGGSGGFFATHPATADRVAELQKLP